MSRKRANHRAGLDPSAPAGRAARGIADDDSVPTYRAAELKSQPPGPGTSSPPQRPSGSSDPVLLTSPRQSRLPPPAVPPPKAFSSSLPPPPPPAPPLRPTMPPPAPPVARQASVHPPPLPPVARQARVHPPPPSPLRAATIPPPLPPPVRQATMPPPPPPVRAATVLPPPARVPQPSVADAHAPAQRASVLPPPLPAQAPNSPVDMKELLRPAPPPVWDPHVDRPFSDKPNVRGASRSKADANVRADYGSVAPMSLGVQDLIDATTIPAARGSRRLPRVAAVLASVVVVGVGAYLLARPAEAPVEAKSVAAAFSQPQALFAAALPPQDAPSEPTATAQASASVQAPAAVGPKLAANSTASPWPFSKPKRDVKAATEQNEAERSETSTDNPYAAQSDQAESPSSAPEEPAEPEAPPPPPPPFDQSAAAAAMAQAASNAASCRPEGSPTGLARVSVTFAPSGRATTAQVSGSFAGTPTGGCIARLFRTARIPPFTGEHVTVHKSVAIR